MPTLHQFDNAFESYSDLEQLLQTGATLSSASYRIAACDIITVRLGTPLSSCTDLLQQFCAVGLPGRQHSVQDFELLCLTCCCSAELVACALLTLVHFACLRAAFQQRCLQPQHSSQFDNTYPALRSLQEAVGENVLRRR